MPTFEIRDYREADAEPMARLYYDSARQLGARRYTPEQVAAWAPAPLDPAVVHARAGDGRVTLVAINAAGEVIAYGDLEADGHIDHLYRRPGGDAPGVASAVLDALLTRGAAMPRLHVEASELARGLFERKGFTVISRRDFEVRGVPIHNYAMERLA